MTLLPWFLQTRLPVVATSSAGPGESEGAGPDLSINRAPAPQFYLGAPGTGAPQHYGQDSFNVLAHGRKLWYMAKPAEAEYSTVSAARFFRSVLPRAREAPLLCEQRGGDVFFVPNGWGHSVLNLETSVGYAVEFSSVLHAFY